MLASRFQDWHTEHVTDDCTAIVSQVRTLVAGSPEILYIGPHKTSHKKAHNTLPVILIRANASFCYIFIAPTGFRESSDGPFSQTRNLIFPQQNAPTPLLRNVGFKSFRDNTLVFLNVN